MTSFLHCAFLSSILKQIIGEKCESFYKEFLSLHSWEKFVQVGLWMSLCLSDNNKELHFHAYMIIFFSADLQTSF